ncbi:unnamed protein product [Rotaria sordida]|uniref:Polyhydroxybutyrate depolymerase n=1 Tax=Rotaria sordida TaxID=392033 RepID=A0A818T6K2_9BILA|nr:unnamed protein product [Rotaria sordida]CAF3678572.1 unnamed protein product [Rotaria sordida]
MSMCLILNVIILLFISLASANVPRTDVTVSGISSGGAMATQLHIGFSKDISGCGILAGPPYYCGGSGLTTAVCMTGPASFIFVSYLESKIKYYASNDYIDNPSNIAGDPVYVFSGKYDKIAYPGVVKLNAGLYTRLNATVKTNFDMPAHHGFPTENFGATCSSLNLANYINNCNFNLAYDMLNHLYGGSLIKPAANSKTLLLGQMLMFDQEAFMSFSDTLKKEGITKSSLSEWIQNNMYLYTPEGWEWSSSGLFHLTMSSESSNKKSITTRDSSASFDDEGFIYFPSACANGKKCSIHVALHGCQQGKSFAGDIFATKAGYLEVAELNNIIVIFPQVRRSLILPTNPMGCWDWWGYSHVYYATQRAPQMAGVKNMIDTVRTITTVFSEMN